MLMDFVNIYIYICFFYECLFKGGEPLTLIHEPLTFNPLIHEPFNPQNHLYTVYIRFCFTICLFFSFRFHLYFLFRLYILFRLYFLFRLCVIFCLIFLYSCIFISFNYFVFLFFISFIFLIPSYFLFYLHF